jgi:hypothetical protein
MGERVEWVEWVEWGVTNLYFSHSIKYNILGNVAVHRRFFTACHHRYNTAPQKSNFFSKSAKF